MIKKIDITRFGLFNGYQWARYIGGDNNTDIFKKVNIIYGRNYSGKTTLSRIFRCVENKELHEKYSNGQFVISDTNNNKITESNLDCMYKVRVYNTDFVRDNLSILHDERGEIRPFTLLGSGNVIAEARIKEIIQELGSIEENSGLIFQIDIEEKKLAAKIKELNLKESGITLKLTEKANKEIKLKPHFVKQGTTYTISNIKAEIKEIIDNPNKEHKLDEPSIEVDKILISEPIKPDILPAKISKPKIQEFINDVRIIVEKKITITNTIKDLLADSLLQEWVDKGRTLHRGNKDICSFCGGRITNERWAILDAHFSKESEELKREIIEEKEKLKRAKLGITNYLDYNGLLKGNYYSSYQQEFEDLKSKWDLTVNQYLDTISILESKLQERYDDIFNQKQLEELKDISDEILETLKQINELSDKNNSKSLTLERDKENARKRLRYSEIANFIDAINYKQDIAEKVKQEDVISSMETELKGLKGKEKRLKDEKVQKELELNDEGEAAKKVNNHLTNFFGHDGLSLDPEAIEGDIPQTKFIIKRGVEKAHNLSEGECSLIAFCYFIAKMEDELNGAENEKLVIFIDDPISSLDNNHIFFMFSLIENIICKDKKYGQLFISTHNLDFLKYIKRLTVPSDDKNKRLIGHFMVIKQKKGSETRCNLIPMPNHLKDYITEYNFLFKEIYNMAGTISGDKCKMYENDFTLFYNLPNNMRKFLECYLFYRFPNTDDPLKKLSKLFDNNIPALINRVINEYSHLSWGDRGTLVMDVNEAETVSKEILKVLKNKDYDHFEALCDSVGVDKNILL